MFNQKINGNDLYRLFQSGVNQIVINKELLNRINVFPVADGDTGSNLIYTLQSAVDFSSPNESFSDMIKMLSDNAVIYARGNSGIIFSEFIRGLSILCENNEIDMDSFKLAVNGATNHLYTVVKNPIEGTILTVIRTWSKYLETIDAKSFDELFDISLPIIKKSVNETTQQLKDLKKHNVPDSGAMGFYLFMEGFVELIHGYSRINENHDWQHFMDIEIMQDFDNDLYRYCTQFSLKDLSISKNQLQEQLTLFGDSIACAGTEKYINLHIHTDAPWQVSKYLKSISKIVNSKVDDMALQNSFRSEKGKIGILTDSVADLDEQTIKELGINLISTNLNVGEHVFLDKKTIKLNDFFVYMDESIEFPSSSQPNDQQIKYCLNTLLQCYEKIIVITVSRQLSGTYQGFYNHIKKTSEYEGIVYLIDSYLNSGAQGLLVKKAAEIVLKNDDIEEDIMQIEKTRSSIKTYVALNNFENLSKSGRINKGVATLANKINMKAILTLDDTGKGEAYGFSLYYKSIENKILKQIKKSLDDKPIEEYVIFYSNKNELTDRFTEKVEKLIKKSPSYCTVISSTTALHVGRDSIAIAYM